MPAFHDFEQSSGEPAIQCPLTSVQRGAGGNEEAQSGRFTCSKDFTCEALIPGHSERTGFGKRTTCLSQNCWLFCDNAGPEFMHSSPECTCSSQARICEDHPDWERIKFTSDTCCDAARRQEVTRKFMTWKQRGNRR